MPEKFLLKVFSGLQFGAEVALDEGDYAIGSGPDDDIQLKDASLNSQHALLKVGPEKIEIRANSGAILFGNGLTLETGDERWVEIEPLSPLVLGSTRLAFGLESANWNTITEDASFRSEVQPNFGKPQPDLVDPEGPRSIWEGMGLKPEQIEAARRFLDPLIERAMTDRRVLYGGIGGVAALFFFIIMFQAIFGGPSGPVVRNPVKDRQAVEAAIAELPFASHIRVVQDADGQISVRGIIKDVTERRAVLTAIQQTGVPLKTRIASAESIVADVDNLILSQGLNVKASLKDDGSLMLSGVINDPAVSEKFLQLVKSQVVGPTSFDFSRLKDGNALLADVIRFARDEGVSPTVNFALAKDGAFIEASGSLVPDQSAVWENFLKNYEDSYAPRIKLKSTVEIGKIAVEPSAPADANAPQAAADGRVLDVNALKTAQAAKSDASLSNKTKQSGPNTPPVAEAEKASAPAVTQQNVPQKVNVPTAVQNSAPSISNAAVSNNTPQPLPETREPLVAEALEGLSRINICTGDRIRDFNDLNQIVLQIDELSTISAESIVQLEKKQQLVLAEFILNPSILRRCITESTDPNIRALRDKSPFLNEIVVNPEFIRFIFRDIKISSLALSGADLTGEVSVLDSTGRRLKRGASIDIYSRVFNIAELGVIIETAAGMELAIFDNQLAWLVRPRFQ